MTVLDAVCNLFTPEVYQSRPDWTRGFHSNQMKVAGAVLDGVTIDEHVELMDSAGIDRALLIAPKMGLAGLEDSWSLDPRDVAVAVERYPDRFRALAGINPHEGLGGILELKRLVQTEGFVGAHLYPHWFALAPDHRLYYPYYAMCAELDVPIQMQVGRCQRYSVDRPMPNVGFPSTIDRIACDFPELKLVGIHVGWPWTSEMISVADKHANVYIGTDAYAPRYLDPELVQYMAGAGSRKVLFGTDWPVIPFGRAVTEMRAHKLPPAAETAVLGANAMELYDWA
jgi:predicted TIM-barrel fold metal-dependent hydrolase